MYHKDFYKGKSEEEIKSDIQKEGFDPVKINDSPGFVYSPHSHPQMKLIAILSGGMRVTVANEEFELEKGDRLYIPGNIIHSAVVGKRGCSFFWSEKIV